MRPYSVGAMLVAALAVLHGQPAAAQTTPETWSFHAAAAAYFVPHDSNYVQPTFIADREKLHLETRFNYEDRSAGSIWAGCNLSVGEAVVLEFTPMFGVVIGSTTGVAPGYKGSLTWRRLELYSESEYVFDIDDSADSFLYTWSEFSVALAEIWRAGLVVQRTKAYETSFDTQRGLLAGVSLGRTDLTAYVFNPGKDTTVVISVGVSF